MASAGQTGLASPKGENRPLHVLLIGINEYKSKHLPNLDCCVSDAESLKTFLEKNLSTTPTSITTLYNENATRKAILDALRALRNDPSIHKGDPILIFYAGHGGRAKAPQAWRTTDGQIQMILPYDCGCELKGTSVHGIPGRTLNALLHKLADEKGDNITVIFDSCHSGLGTRGRDISDPKLETKIRGIDLEVDIPSDLDAEDWFQEKDWTDTMTRALSTPGSLANSGLASHVLLAACHPTEFAHEGKSGGHFTRALVKVLHSFGSKPFSNQDLIDRIGILPQQQPQCEGKNRDRLFLATVVPIRQEDTYLVQKKGNEYIMEAGALEGISVEAIFVVYEARTKVQIGTLVASEPGPFSTTMRLIQGHSHFDIKEKAIAVQTGQGEGEILRIHVPPDATPQLRQLVRQTCDLSTESNHSERTILPTQRDRADIELKCEGDKIVFDTLYEPATRHGINRLDIDIPLEVDKLAPALRVAAHYYWHLRRAMDARNEDTNPVTFGEVESRAETYNRDAIKTSTLHGPNLLRNGVVDIVAEGPKKLFGMKFENTSEDDLYVWVFYFDHRKMDIMLVHSPPTRGTQKYSKRPPSTTSTGIPPKRGYVPLEPGEFIHIGYGNSAVPAFVFNCVDCELDLGFFVFFVSTKPVDLSNMPQDSKTRNPQLSDKEMPSLADYWHTIVVPVIQRLHPLPGPIPPRNVWSRSAVLVILSFFTLIIALLYSVYLGA